MSSEQNQTKGSCPSEPFGQGAGGISQENAPLDGLRGEEPAEQEASASQAGGEDFPDQKPAEGQPDGNGARWPHAAEHSTEFEQAREQGAPGHPQAADFADLQGQVVEPLRADLDAVRESLDGRIAAYEETVRTLHAQVEDLQRQQLIGLMKPVFQEFADLQADLQSAEAQARGRGDATYAEEFEHFGQAIDKLMDHFDLESVGAVPGGPFVRRTHMAVLARSTSDPQQDQTIARVVRQGYRVIDEPRALIPARVVVWKYDPSYEKKEEPEESVNS